MTALVILVPLALLLPWGIVFLYPAIGCRFVLVWKAIKGHKADRQAATALRAMKYSDVRRPR